MKLNNLSAISEILSSIAIVATLLFLVVEVRDNTAAVQAATYQNLVNQRNERYALWSTDERMTKMMVAIMNRGALEGDADTLLMAGLLTQLEYENAFMQREYGVLSDDVWPYFQKRICESYERGDKSRFEKLDLLLSDDYVKYRSRTCRS